MDERVLTITIEDTARPFDPTTQILPEEEELDLPLDERPIGGLGVLLAAMSLNALKLVLPPDTPRLANLGLHTGVFLFAAGVSILTGILAGLAPAFQADV